MWLSQRLIITVVGLQMQGDRLLYFTIRKCRTHVRSAGEGRPSMEWIVWIGVFVAGYFCGAATMALMALSSRRTRLERSAAFDRDAAIQGPTTVF